MTQEEMRRKVRPTIKEVARMGVWDGVDVLFENGEPVVIAVLQRPPIIQFLSKIGAMKLPSLPKRVQGVRCKVVLRNPASHK